MDNNSDQRETLWRATLASRVQRERGQPLLSTVTSSLAPIVTTHPPAAAGRAVTSPCDPHTTTTAPHTSSDFNHT